VGLPRDVQGVVLDMDGTLLDTEIIYVRSYVETMADFGHELPESFLHTLIGGPRGLFQARLRERLGPDFPYEAHRAAYAVRRTERLAAGVPLKPGAEALLDYIAARRLPVGVATAATREHADEHLARAGLRRHFSVVLTRDDVVNSKPAPDLFLAVAEALGVAAADCLAVEDSFNGVRSAVAAGMMTVMVPDIVPADDEMRALCVAVCRDLHGVVELLG
jgi:HAD superfamily hydrolase (TIGR01509 family)